jgi:hypothetical protein
MAYILVTKWVDRRLHWLVFLSALSLVLAVRLYLPKRFPVWGWQGPLYSLNGSDQFILGSRYSFIAIAVLLTVAGCTLFHMLQIRRKGVAPTNYFSVPLQLFLAGLLTLPFLPDAIWLPRYTGAVSLVCSRFTLAIAVLGCCVLAGLRSRILLLVLTSCIAIAYFTLVYQDAARTYAMEKQADDLVAKLPQGARVLTKIDSFRDSRVFSGHVMDRACVQRCFNIINYEAASGQFRLRAAQGNRIVAANSQDIYHMGRGDYVVQPDDLPLWQVFQCGPNQVDLCLRPLHAGSLLNFIPGEAERARELE